MTSLRQLADALVDDARQQQASGAVLLFLSRHVARLPMLIAGAIPTLSDQDRKAIEQLCGDALREAALVRAFGREQEQRT
jgi:hypothetical protein